MCVRLGKCLKKKKTCLAIPSGLDQEASQSQGEVEQEKNHLCDLGLPSTPRTPPTGEYVSDHNRGPIVFAFGGFP